MQCSAALLATLVATDFSKCLFGRSLVPSWSAGRFIVFGLSEAIERAVRFREMGADITFIEAPHDEAELRLICSEVDGPRMVNIVEGGKTPSLSPAILKDIGFSLATYPLTGLMAAIAAIKDTLFQLNAGKLPKPPMDFETLQRVIGFEEYFESEERYL